MVDTLELKITRTEYTQNSTIGEFSVAGSAPLFYTLEDVVRAPGVKVKKKTAIPPGRYRVDITPSPSHQYKMMLQIMDVPMFEGIRIHGGNDEFDTEGCPLVGMHKGVDRIDTCKPALDVVMDLVKAYKAIGKQVWITIENTQEPVV